MRARRFCPWCASPLGPIDGPSQPCSGCGTPFYHNASPCCAVLVVDDAGRVLLARRAVAPGAGLWDLPGGFLDPEETPAAGAIRELLEETGCTIVVDGVLAHVIDHYGEDGEAADATLNVVVVARIVAGEPVAADDVAELRWFAREDVPPAAEFAFANSIEALRLLG